MELATGASAILLQKARCESVGAESHSVFKEPFPDPGQQAEALLEICQGDVDKAQAIAVTNLRFTKCQADRIYWSRVEMLILKQEQAVVVERLETNRRKRKAAIKQPFTND